MIWWDAGHLIKNVMVGKYLKLLAHYCDLRLYTGTLVIINHVSSQLLVSVVRGVRPGGHGFESCWQHFSSELW